MDTIAVLHYLPEPSSEFRARLAALEWWNAPAPDVAEELNGVYGRSLLQLAGWRFGDLHEMPRCGTCGVDAPDTAMALQIWLVRTPQGGVTTGLSPANQDRWYCMACGKISKSADRTTLSAHQRMAILQATWARAPHAFGPAFLASDVPIPA